MTSTYLLCGNVSRKDQRGLLSPWTTPHLGRGSRHETGAQQLASLAVHHPPVSATPGITGVCFYVQFFFPMNSKDLNSVLTPAWPALFLPRIPSAPIIFFYIITHLCS